jgi:hypothetical protein
VKKIVEEPLKHTHRAHTALSEPAILGEEYRISILANNRKKLSPSWQTIHTLRAQVLIKQHFMAGETSSGISTNAYVIIGI